MAYLNGIYIDEQRGRKGGFDLSCIIKQINILKLYELKSQHYLI
jgi:hypothetical protein